MLTHAINNQTDGFAIIYGMDLQEDEVAGWKVSPQVAAFLGKLQGPLFHGVPEGPETSPGPSHWGSEVHHLPHPKALCGGAMRKLRCFSAGHHWPVVS